MSDAYDALNRLAKWRTILTGWQLGTRSDSDPEAAAVRDIRELLLLLRVEVTAVTRILIEEGVTSQEHLADVVAEEAELLSAAYEKRFPGFRATDLGIHMKMPEAAETMKRMGFKP